jgi:hypothetical protein
LGRGQIVSPQAVRPEKEGQPPIFLANPDFRFSEGVHQDIHHFVPRYKANDKADTKGRQGFDQYPAKILEML